MKRRAGCLKKRGSHSNLVPHILLAKGVEGSEDVTKVIIDESSVQDYNIHRKEPGADGYEFYVVLSDEHFDS
jgi:hypothetical protein